MAPTQWRMTNRRSRAPFASLMAVGWATGCSVPSGTGADEVAAGAPPKETVIEQTTDVGDPNSVGGQTADEGDETTYPWCRQELNYAGELSTLSSCRAHTYVPDWSIGDPTPSGTYECVCSASSVQFAQAGRCEQALVDVCHVDLNAPTACSFQNKTCWPIRDQPGSWQCECTFRSTLLTTVEAATCDDARVSACGADLVYRCEGGAGDAAAPVGGGCTLADGGVPP